MKDELDLGDNHRLVFAEYRGEPRVGASVIHIDKDGNRCEGWAAFRGRSWANSFLPVEITAWDVVQNDPITLTPSILCRACGDHGFVTNGKWVRA